VTDDSWARQGEQAKSGLAPLRGLEGRWEGTGVCHGQAVSGQIVGRLLLDGSWLEVEETLRGSDGAVAHSDRCLYRFNVEEERLEVIQLFEHASMTTSIVEPTPDGFRWVTGPGAPQLRFWMEASALRYTVLLPDESAPAADMTYQRA